MRVMQVMAGGPVGGIETFFFDGVEALAESGLEQLVIVRDNVPARIERLRALKIPVMTTSFDGWWRWPTSRTMKTAYAEFQPSVAQFWTGRAASFARRGAWRNIGWFGGYRQMKDFGACDDFIGITPDLMRHILEGGANPDRTALIHTFSALPEKISSAASREEFNTPASVPLLLVLARLHKKKGLDTQLEALTKIPQAYLWIAGEGEERDSLLRLTEKLGLSSRVRFLGWRTDRDRLLAAADICVVPSRYEPFGTVMAEAWAAGVPLVAAASQGPKAYVNDQVNGLLVPIDDANALATALNRVIADAALRARIVEGGHRTYDERFTKEAYVRGTLAFYEKVAQRPSTA